VPGRSALLPKTTFPIVGCASSVKRRSRDAQDRRYIRLFAVAIQPTESTIPMCTRITRNALILSGGRGLRPGPGAGTRHLPPPRTHALVTNPRRGRRMRQLFSGRGGCACEQMSASVSQHSAAAAVMVGGVAQLQLRSRQGCCGSGLGTWRWPRRHGDAVGWIATANSIGLSK